MSVEGAAGRCWAVAISVVITDVTARAATMLTTPGRAPLVPDAFLIRVVSICAAES
jgi:hypothetical protein